MAPMDRAILRMSPTMPEAVLTESDSGPWKARERVSVWEKGEVGGKGSVRGHGCSDHQWGLKKAKGQQTCTTRGFCAYLAVWKEKW